MTTREYHTIITKAGFSNIETGGGCDAFSKYNESGEEILITASDDPCVPNVHDTAIVSKDGDILGYFTAAELVNKLGEF
jgi:hypothetical protein